MKKKSQHFEWGSRHFHKPYVNNCKFKKTPSTKCMISPTFWGVLTSIFSRTAGDSSFTGSSFASAASASVGADDDPGVTADAPPVTNSFNFWFSCLQLARKWKWNLCSAEPACVHVLEYSRMTVGKTLQYRLAKTAEAAEQLPPKCETKLSKVIKQRET